MKKPAGRRKYHVGLSYASSETAIARDLKRALEQEDFDVFLDQDAIEALAAESLRAKLIDTYSVHCDLIVPIVSQAYFLKFWTQLEAQVWKPLIADRRVLPIFVDGFTDANRIRDIVGVSTSADNWTDLAVAAVRSLVGGASRD